MPKIILLDEATTNQIAAGEVVERPSSVVKELTENSFDAGATRIDIEIKGGGLQEIKVIDNGFGMDEDDCTMAFQRHATSKITSLSDLEEIASMGFRGEALPSIAAVSKTVMITRPLETVKGTKLEMQGGRLLSRSPQGCPPGTSISVQNLFFNTPARLKHMKSISTENGKIIDVVSRLALTRPDISIKLTIDGRNLLNTSGDNKLLNTLAAIYGAQVAKEMISFENFEEDIVIKGLVSPPSINRSTKKNLTSIINGRYVYNYLINTAIIEGYGTLLPKGRYPLAVITVSVAPSQLDINVHPSKMTVRVSGENKLFNLVRRTVAATLRSDCIIPAYTPAINEPMKVPAHVSKTEQGDFPYSSENQHLKFFEKRPLDDLLTAPNIDNSQIPEPKNNDLDSNDPLADAYPIGFLPTSYILAGCSKGMMVIDHHAAHERILYEQILQLFSQDTIKTQILLVPQIIQLSLREYQTAENHMGLLSSLGIIIETLDSCSVMIREVPSELPGLPPEELLRDSLESIMESGNIVKEKIVDDIAASAACKAAIKAGTRSSADEAWAIINDLKKTRVPYSCPHGRPTIIYITEQELRARFKRT